MLISEFIEKNSWNIDDTEETREYNIMDFDEWLEYENDYLIEEYQEQQYIEEDEEQEQEIITNANDYYNKNPEFKRFIDNKFYDYKQDNEYKGVLNQYDVRESMLDSTYNHDLQEYIQENQSDYIQEFKEYIQELKQEYKDYNTELIFREWLDEMRYTRNYNEWFDDEKKDEAEQDFIDNRYSDLPIWLTAWEFPSGYSAEELNDMDISGIVFFEINKNGIYETFVSLSGCGMDMSPSLYCAYLLYSNLKKDDEMIKELLCKVQTKGLEYMGYVMGKKHLDKFVEEIGREMAIRMDKRGRAEYKKFDDQLKKLTKARDNGEMDNATTGLLGMMSYFNTQKCRVDEEIKKDE